MRIWLGYHVAAREYNICKMIKMAILTKEPETVVKIGNMLSTKEIIDFAPDVIVSHPVRTEYATAMFTIQKLLTQAAFVPMVVEGYVDVNNKRVREAYIDRTPCPIDLIDAMIYWGEILKQVDGGYLIEFKKIRNIDQVHVFGYPLYDKKYIKIINNQSQSVKRIQKWMRQYKKCVSVASAFSLTVMSDEEYMLEGHISSDEKTNLKKIYETLSLFHEKKRFYEEYSNAYIKLVCVLAKKNPDIGFVYKLHPVEIDTEKEKELPYLNLLKHLPNVLVIHEAVPFSAILQESYLLLHYGSTLAMEAYIYQIPSVRLKLNGKGLGGDNERFDDDSTYNAECSDVSAVQGYINKANFSINKDVDQKLLDFFNWTRGEEYKPVEGMADFLLSIKSCSFFKKNSEGVKVQLKGNAARNFRMQIYYELLKNIGRYNKKEMLEDIKIIYKLTINPLMMLNDLGFGFFKAVKKGIKSCNRKFCFLRTL